MNTVLRSTFALCLAAAAGCSELTLIGVSDENTPLTAAASALHATSILAKPGELLTTYGPPLGDIDGDGLEDLILYGYEATQEGEVRSPRTIPAYLFYGRAAFPEQLSTADADATFETGNYSHNLTLGDVNGDGLGDIVLTHVDGYQLIFGRSERYAGHYAKFSDAGPVVTYPYTAGPSADAWTGLLSVESLGDLNGDGRNDLVVRTLDPDPTPKTTWPLDTSTDFILAGRSDDWPTGAWDSSWAIAQLGTYADANSGMRGKLGLSVGADIDGDGYSDVLTQSVIFYGKPEGLRGTLDAELADATFPVDSVLSPIGDVDGDGAVDLTTYAGRVFPIIYGKRFVGDVVPTPDLSFAVRPGEYGGAYVGDIDADGQRDLILIGYEETKSSLYVVHGDGKRATGERTTDEPFQPPGYPAPQVLSRGFVLSGGGDFDGDGSADLILSVNTLTPDAENGVHLLPGSMKNPE